MVDFDGLPEGKKRNKLDHRIQYVEKRDRFLIKDRSSDSAVMEEVFDKSTIMVLYDLLNKGLIKQLSGVLKSGKESRIYRGIGPDGSHIAIKIYLVTSSDFKSGMIPYIEGDPRFTITRKDSRSLIYLWAQKEFKNLQKAYESGIRVPKPIHVEKNVLLMEFIGEHEIAAPTLKEKPPKNPRTMYRTLLKYIKLLFRKAKLVHGDLSEYNIFNLNGEPVIFDMSQSIHVDHPLAEQFLMRDLNGLNKFFKKLGVPVKSPESLLEWITSK